MRPCRPAVLLALGFLLVPVPGSAQSAPPQSPAASVEAGDSDAAFQAGEAYAAGVGVPQNYSRAVAFYETAAAAGHHGAQNRLARLLSEGLGLPRDPERAAALFEKAAEDGQPAHLVDLALVYETGLGVAADPARAAMLYDRAAQQGDADAAVSLGVLYQEGRGVEQDVGKAVALYRGPAEAGHARAQNNLGLVYSRGIGVAQDYEAAVEWFSRAAKQGLPQAIRNLGVMYENGFGVALDEEEAKRLYRIAGQFDGETIAALLERTGMIADPLIALPSDPARAPVERARAGDATALFAVGYIAATLPEPAFAAAARAFRRAAHRGHPVAMADLGLLYFRGLGVPQDYVYGYQWLSLAVTAGLTEIAPLRDRLARQMTAAQINEAQAAAARMWDAISP